MRRAITTLLLYAVVGLSLQVGSAGASDAWIRALTPSAERLWNPVPPGGRIAIRPLDGDESGLPESLMRAVEQALADALLASAPSGAVVVNRRDLPAVWDEVMSFSSASTARLLSDAAVDGLLVPNLVERRDGVALSAVLLSVRQGEIGDLLATLPPTELTVDLARFDLASADGGARRLGVALAEGLRVAVDPTQAFNVRVERAGRRGAVEDWFAGLVAEHLVRRLGSAPLYVTTPLRDLGGQAAAGVVRLEVEAWDLGARVDFQARAVMGSGSTRATVRVAVASLPAGFLPLTRDGGRVGLGMFEAAGAFEPAGPVDRREVLFAARAMARAAIVDDALDRSGIGAVGRGSKDLVAAMSRIGDGVPHEEIWRDGTSSGIGARQILKARVSRVGGGQAPRLETTVERALYRPGVPLGARVMVGGGRAYIAAYVWQADDTVVRIAPAQGPARRVEPEMRVQVPGPGDPEVSAAPFPGSRETIEAIIVVASALPFDAGSLAPMVRATADQSLMAATEMSAFLDELAKLDLARVSLRVLPYRVRAAD